MWTRSTDLLLSGVLGLGSPGSTGSVSGSVHFLGLVLDSSGYGFRSRLVVTYSLGSTQIGFIGRLFFVFVLSTNSEIR